MANSGKEYEELVRDIQYSLINAENIPSLKNINIEKKKKKLHEIIKDEKQKT